MNINIISHINRQSPTFITVMCFLASSILMVLLWKYSYQFENNQFTKSYGETIYFILMSIGVIWITINKNCTKQILPSIFLLFFNLTTVIYGFYIFMDDTGLFVVFCYISLIFIALTLNSIVPLDKQRATVSPPIFLDTKNTKNTAEDDSLNYKVFRCRKFCNYLKQRSKE